MVGPIGFRVAQLISDNTVSEAPPKPKTPPPDKPGPDKPVNEPKDDPKVEPPVPPTPRVETPKCPADGKPIHVNLFPLTADMAALRDQRPVFDYVKAAGGEKLGRDVDTETDTWIKQNLVTLANEGITPPSNIADYFKNGSTTVEIRSFIARAFAYALNIYAPKTKADKASFNKVVADAVKAIAEGTNPKITPQALIDTLTARWTPNGPRKGIDVAKFVDALGELKGANAVEQATDVKNITAADKKNFAPLNVADLAPVLVAANAPERYRQDMAHELARALECEADRISKDKKLSRPKAITAKTLFTTIQATDLAGTAIPEADRIPLAPIVRDGKQVMGILAQPEAKLLELARLLNRGVSGAIVEDAVKCKKPGGVCFKGKLQISGGSGTPTAKEESGGIFSNVVVASLTWYPSSIKWFLGLDASGFHAIGAARLDSSGKSPFPIEKRGQVFQPVQATVFGGGVLGPVTITARFGMIDVDYRGAIAGEHKTFGAKTGGGGLLSDTLLGGGLTFGGEYEDAADNVDKISWSLDVAFGDSGSDLSIYSQVEDPETGKPLGHFESKDQTAVYLAPAVSFMFLKNRLRLDLLGAIHATFPSEDDGVTTGAWGVQLGGAFFGNYKDAWDSFSWTLTGAARGYYDSNDKMNHVVNVGTRLVPVKSLALDVQYGFHTGEQPTTMGSAAGSGRTSTTEGQTSFGGVPSVLARPANLSSHEINLGVDWRFSKLIPAVDVTGWNINLGARCAYLTHAYVPEAVLGSALGPTKIDEGVCVITLTGNN